MVTAVLCVAAAEDVGFPARFAHLFYEFPSLARLFYEFSSLEESKCTFFGNIVYVCN